MSGIFSRVASAVFGNTSGTAIAAGYVGEKFTSSDNTLVNGSTTSGTYTDTAASITLTPGILLITANIPTQNNESAAATGQSVVVGAIRTGSTVVAGAVGGFVQAIGAALNGWGNASVSTVVQITVNTTYKTSFAHFLQSGSGTFNPAYRGDTITGFITAIRIA